MSKTAKKQVGKEKTRKVTLVYTEAEFRAISALAAFNNESVEVFVKRTHLNILEAHVTTIGEELTEALGL